tara:strand:+ start:329 stop:721 length:393 start_codon:yes stop_codon:yes gene_type:complete
MKTIISYLLIFILFLFANSTSSLDNFIGTTLLCKGKYQILGYQFVDNENVIRHASSESENDYYFNNGKYTILGKTINLDIEGNLFKRSINIETLELFIGVHSDNSLVCVCQKFEGNEKEFLSYLKKYGRV